MTYHATPLGGAQGGYGTVWRVSPLSGDEQTQYTFTGGIDGLNPSALIPGVTTLYGVSHGIEHSNQDDYGTVFSLVP